MEEPSIEIIRHSCAHIMAAAVGKIFPDAKFAIGPAIKDGFYYDINVNATITEDDLKRIEDAMRQDVKNKTPFERKELPIDDALKFFTDNQQKYKVELINELKVQGVETVSLYQTGDFIDLCRGPHVEHAGRVKNFKLLSLSGAYWRGDEENDQLIRIYGTAFKEKDELKNYLKNLEEAKKRDHRLLGKQLRLFDIYHNDAGAGLVFYLPKGAVLRKLIEDWEIAEHLKRGYQQVITPFIMDSKLWKRSGHLDFYNEFMYQINKENQDFVLKPMNCPGHILIYKSELHSWRDLPLRMFELGTVHRYEKSGVLHGLLRVRGFTQDDAHIFCTKDDLYNEIDGVLDFVKQTMDKFGFTSFEAELSTRPEKFIGDKANWDMAEDILEKVLKNKNISYNINAGDGAFYGPKIDIKLTDALGRQWQCATVQLDYNIPERFDLTYKDKEGKDTRVVMLHRVILGSIERFIATLIEHYAGRFPLWLAPVQVSVLNVKPELKEYATLIKNKLFDAKIRVEDDLREETLQKKIRQKELQKIPYIIVVGDKERENNNVSVRRAGRQDLGVMGIDDFIDLVKKEVETGEIRKN